MITLTLKEQPTVPLEAEVLSPDVLGTLAQEEIRALPVFLGKRQHRLDAFFDVEGAASDELVIRGDAGKVKWIGRGMTRGRITIHGNAGDWVGAEMSGGLIHIRGNAGGQIGAAYRGSLSGMKDGTILIGGSAGL